MTLGPSHPPPRPWVGSWSCHLPGAGKASCDHTDMRNTFGSPGLSLRSGQSALLLGCD